MNKAAWYSALCRTNGSVLLCLNFFFNDTATTEIYTLSLHDALPISHIVDPGRERGGRAVAHLRPVFDQRSEEHTSELQSRLQLVCRLLPEQKTQAASRTPPHPGRPSPRRRTRPRASP